MSEALQDFTHRDPATALEDSGSPPAVLLDRNLASWSEFSVRTAASPQGGPLLGTDAAWGNCTVTLCNGFIQASFHSEHMTHQLGLRLPTQRASTGMGVRFRLRNWKTVRYVAIGYTYEGVFRHVKIAHAVRGEWIDFLLGHQDLVYGLQNEWQSPGPADITDARVYVSGTVGTEGALVDVERVWCFRENPAPEEGLLSSDPTAWTRISPALLDSIYDYLGKCFRNAEAQAKTFLEAGGCPLYGEISLAWPSSAPLPPAVSEVNTYRFSWHALHPAAILLVHARSTGELSPLFAARDFVSAWMDRSYFRPDEDKKFAWYDHSTAERLLTLVLMWAVGVEWRFDLRFMARLHSLIFRHGQLLASEAFYASHQRNRYHNHAWFQDVALMAAGLAMTDLPCGTQWFEHALNRLGDQLKQLIVRDQGFAVSVENSIGYHHGIQRLVEFAGNLVSSTAKASSIPDVARELSRFSDFLRYPDRRAPAQGDTFRRTNLSAAAPRSTTYAQPECAILPKAGYAIVKGNHDGIPFMFTVFATSLCRTHKHEDDLSFTLFFDGIEWLIDPSFFSHEYAAPIPAYLRSAAAHNVPFVPGLRYSIEPGLAALDGARNGDSFTVTGKHRAYGEVVVERQVQGSLSSLTLAFSDCVRGDAAHASQGVIWRLHCGDGVQAAVDGRLLTLTHPESKYCLAIELPTESVDIAVGRDDGDRLGGITGLGFMERAAIHTVEFHGRVNELFDWNLAAKMQ